MEKFQQGRPHPYIIHGATSHGAPPPSYDQVYGGQIMLSHNNHQPEGQYHIPVCPPRACAMTNNYPAPMMNPPLPTHVQPHNPALSNGLYYPDPRRLVTSSKLQSSNGNTNLSNGFTRHQSDSPNPFGESRSCCSLEKATRIIGIACLVLSMIGLSNTVYNFKALGSFGTGLYIIIVYVMNITFAIVLLQGVKKENECLVLMWLIFTKLSIIFTIVSFVFYVIAYKDMVNPGKDKDLAKQISGVGLLGDIGPYANFVGTVIAFILDIIIMTACFYVVRTYRKLIKGY